IQNSSQRSYKEGQKYISGIEQKLTNIKNKVNKTCLKLLVRNKLKSSKEKRYEVNDKYRQAQNIKDEINFNDEIKLKENNEIRNNKVVYKIIKEDKNANQEFKVNDSEYIKVVNKKLNLGQYKNKKLQIHVDKLERYSIEKVKRGQNL